MTIDPFIAGLPKVELHMHIEGSFEPELMVEVAARNGVTLKHDGVDALRAAYDFTDLQSFLDIYYQGMSVLLTERDFYDLTWAYLSRSAAQNVRHAEIFFDPQGHTHRGVSIDTALAGITAAMDAAAGDLGVSTALIPHFLRHLSEADALETLDALLPHGDRFAAFGLDSSELGHPPSKFRDLFARCKAEGFKIQVHAGEEGPPAYVTEALDILQVDRIDHGNRALEDAALTQRLVDMGIALTVCPLSNLRLHNCDRIENHPLGRMLDLGLKATINSDDPAYFGGYMNENLQAVADGIGLTRAQMVTLSRNAIAASYAPADRKAALSTELDAYASNVQ